MTLLKMLIDANWIAMLLLRNLAGDGFNKLEKLKWLEIRHCPELIRTIQFLRGKDRSYLSHVEVIELDGFTLKRPLESKCSTQEDDTNRSSIKDVISSSNHLHAQLLICLRDLGGHILILFLSAAPASPQLYLIIQIGWLGWWFMQSELN